MARNATVFPFVIDEKYHLIVFVQQDSKSLKGWRLGGGGAEQVSAVSD